MVFASAQPKQEPQPQSGPQPQQAGAAALCQPFPIHCWGGGWRRPLGNGMRCQDMLQMNQAVPFQTTRPAQNPVPPPDPVLFSLLFSQFVSLSLPEPFMLCAAPLHHLGSCITAAMWSSSSERSGSSGAECTRRARARQAGLWYKQDRVQSEEGIKSLGGRISCYQ